MAMDCPEHERFDDESRGDSSVGNAPEKLPPTPIFEVLAEPPDQPATRPLEPQGG
jgi:hypothetical protein